MAARHKYNTASPAEWRMVEREPAEGQDAAWAQAVGAPGAVVYDRLRDRERALVPGLRWLSQDEEGEEEGAEEEDDEEEEEEGSEGYHCQICGYHTDQLQPFNVHLHAAHPTVVLQELYGLLGLTGGPIPGLGVSGGPIPGLGASGGSIPGLGASGGPIPGLGASRGPIPGLGASGSPIPGLGVSGGPIPGLGAPGGPIPGLGPATGPISGLGPSAGSIPGLGPATGPIPGLGPATGPISGLGPSADPIPELGPATGPIPGLGPATGPISGLGPSAGPIPGLGPATGPILGLGPATGPIPGLGPVTGPIPGLGPSAGPIPGLGPATGPIPGLGPATGPIPGLGPTTGPIPGLGPTTGPIPSLGPATGPIPGLGPPGCPAPCQASGGGPDTRPGQGEGQKGEGGKLDMVHIDLTGEEEAGEQEMAGSGPAPSQEPRLASSLRQARSEVPREPSPGPELEAEGPLAEAFSRFPYPSPEELARCGRSAGLPAERVRVWFAVQRLRRGISWTPEEVREARDRLWHRPGILRLPVPPPGLLPVPVPASPGREAQDGASGPPGGGGLKKARTSPDGADSPEALHRQPRPSPAPGERRWRKTKAQLAALKSSLARDRYPGEAERGRVQARTGLGKADIKRWFSDSCHQLRGLPASSSDRRGDALPRSHELSPLPAPQRGPAWKAEVRGVGEGEVVEEEEEEEKASGLPGAPAVTETANRALVPSPGRPRKTKEQLATLKTFFLLSQWPSGEDYSQLVERTGLARADIIQWFGDTRYALKNGQLKWVRRGAGGLSASQSPGAEPGPGADCGPLEEYLSRHGAHPRQDDLCRLCLESRMNARQVAEWFRRRRGRGRGGRTPEAVAEDGGSEEDRPGQGGGDGEGSSERKADNVGGHVVRVML